MFVKRLFVLFVLIASSAYSQYGSVELNTGGFSLVPAFTDDQPNFILNLGTSTDRRVTGSLIANIRVEGMKPRGGIFITRYKLIDKKLKLHLGAHLPAFQVDEDYHMDTFFAREVLATYQLNESVGFTGMFIRGTGMNNDFKMKLLNFMTIIRKNSFVFTTQLYGMDFENTYGIAQAISYTLSKKLSINGFLNKTLSNGSTISTLGLRYHM
ncbi:MAG: hypothetical protein HWD84_00870 [Flavobacteriaceae bacterium]|jgi:hypothetical protein|nr:hypothetical protein [Flavobacteriaceae bacterium]NVJ72556.1 hypothetical protein [Flavobacteriaceae bacterium]